jgi:small subunit ribosomal protein S7
MPPVKIDAKYQSEQVAKFTNTLMRAGKKDLAAKIVHGSLGKAQEELNTEPVQILNQAIENVRPEQEVRSRRVGGATYQVPMPVGRKRGDSLAMRWIISAARSRTGEMSENLAEELISAYKGEGNAIKKKEDIHRMAEANRAFAHFRW